MPRRGKPPGFTNPEIRARAIATRLANPHGKRGSHRYEDVPGLWVDHQETTLGERVGPMEKAALALLATEHLAGVLGLLFEVVETALETIKEKQESGKNLTVADVTLVGKCLDKVAPDLRADTRATPTRTTRFVIGAPLQRLMENGATLAGEVREQGDDDA